MDADFWHQKWQAKQIGFHNAEPNPLLLAHIDKLALAAGSRVFVPLCGKTLDIGWLLAGGYEVVGAELSELAVSELFQELGVVPRIQSVGGFRHYHADGLDVFVGDIFQLDAVTLGRVDAVYDRAALVALPAAMRNSYPRHLMQITRTAPQLLITYDYDQTQIAGPPFSVSVEEVHSHYADAYRITALEHLEVEGGLKGVPSRETVWLLD